MKATPRILPLTPPVLPAGRGPDDGARADRDPHSVRMPSVNANTRAKNPRVRGGWEFRGSGIQKDASSEETPVPSSR